jgi:hypothetical protein
MGSKKVYITQSAMYAFIDRSDGKHQMAGIFSILRSGRISSVHIPSTIMSTYERIVTHMSHSIAREFLQTIFTSSIDIMYVDEPLMKAAAKLVITTTSVHLTLEQAITNIVCDKSQTSTICTFEYFPFLFGTRAFTLPY